MWQWERPAVIGLGPILLAAAIFGLRFLEKRYFFPAALCPPGGTAPRTPFGVRLARRLANASEAFAGLSLIVALAGPVVIIPREVWFERGADLLFILDSSPSMSARDARPEADGEADVVPISRFEAARNFIRSYIEPRGADAVGLIGVGQEAALLVPPTVDRKAFLDRLDSLAIAELGDGTALGSALAVAAYHLRASRADRKIVILISDGENNAGAIHPVTAAQSLKSLGAELRVIGVGSVGEVPIDYVDPVSLVRRSGILVSRFDEAGLKAMAEAGGGAYFSAGSPGALATAFGNLELDNPVRGQSRRETRIIPRHQIFLIAALIGLVLGHWIRRFVLGAYP